MIYCYKYATEHYRDFFAANYYKILCGMSYKKDMTIDSECSFLNAVMENAVLTGDLEDLVSKSFSMVPYDSLLHAEIKRNRECRAKGTYYGRYVAQLNELYPNRSSMYIDDEVKNELESTLISGVSCNERCCAVLLAFTKITGIVLDKDILMGKQLLISLWPQMEESEFWECENIITTKQAKWVK